MHNIIYVFKKEKAFLEKRLILFLKVTQIQNAGLGEHRIRDLNDQINKLLKEKKHWEIRIKELGGTDIK